jgi:RNA polymerase sigma-70 factor (family 1)
MNYRNLSDEAVLLLFKDEDAHAYKEIYLRYWKQVYQVAYKKLHSKELAEELTQNLFVDLWKRRNTIRIDNLSAYLFGSLKYAIINYFKSVLVHEKYNLHVLQASKPHADNTDHLILLHDLSEALNKGIDLLPKKTAEVFKLSRISHYSVKDISRELNISEKSVEYHITQSLKTMRFHLKEYFVLALLLGFWLK